MLIDGYIKYYKLEKWWLSTFSDEEKNYIINKFNPLGSSEKTLTTGKIDFSNQPVTQFLSSLSGWFKEKDDHEIFVKIHSELVKLRKKEPDIRPGTYKGSHYTTYVEEVKSLKRMQLFDEAEEILLHLIDAIEEELLKSQESLVKKKESLLTNKSQDPLFDEIFGNTIDSDFEPLDPAPWYYQQLAMIYRKQKRYLDEIAILTRYQLSCTKPYHKEEVNSRIEKATQLLQKSNIKNK